MKTKDVGLRQCSDYDVRKVEGNGVGICTKIYLEIFSEKEKVRPEEEKKVTDAPEVVERPQNPLKITLKI